MAKRKRLCMTSTNDVEAQNSQSEDQTVDQQSPRQEDQQPQQQTSQGEGSQKKGRGHNAKSATWNMSSDTKIVVTFNKDGKLVRMADHVGVQYDDWRKVPEHKKEDMYSIVKSKFVIHPTETEFIKKWIFYNMGKKWRHWKGLLKERAYDPSLTIDIRGLTRISVRSLLIKKTKLRSL